MWLPPLALQGQCAILNHSQRGREVPGVERVTFDKLTAFVARPLRALMDLVALRKVEWSGLDWLTSGMRIDDEALLALTEKDFVAVKSVYKHKAVNAFLSGLEDVVLTAKRAHSRGSLHD